MTHDDKQTRLQDFLGPIRCKSSTYVDFGYFQSSVFTPNVGVLQAGVELKRVVPLSHPIAERFWRKVTFGGPSDCWTWNGSRGGGYGQFRITTKLLTGAHRVAFLLANGWMDETLEVLHDCDNPPCVNPAHLRQGTHAENLAEAKDKGRTRGPLTRTFRIFNEKKVRELLKLRADGLDRKALAKHFGATVHTVSAILYGKTWKHVTDPSPPDLRERMRALSARTGGASRA